MSIDYSKLAQFTHRKVDDTIKKLADRYGHEYVKQIHNWAKSTRHSHNKRNIPIAMCNLALISYAIIHPNCSLCNQRFIFNHNYYKRTLDVIDITKIPVESDNIQLLCCRCNSVKSNKTYQQLLNEIEAIPYWWNMNKFTQEQKSYFFNKISYAVGATR